MAWEDLKFLLYYGLGHLFIFLPIFESADGILRALEESCVSNSISELHVGVTAAKQKQAKVRRLSRPQELEKATVLKAKGAFPINLSKVEVK